MNRGIRANVIPVGRGETMLSDKIDLGGDRTARPLILLHGGGLNRKMWLPQMEQLSDLFRIITPDLPGHGARGDEPFSLDGATASLSDTIRDEADGPAVVVGLSLGGYVAMTHARRHPDQIMGMVLSGCSVNYRGVLRLIAKASGLALQRFQSQSRFEAAQAKRLRGAYAGPIAEAIIAGGCRITGAVDGLLNVASTDFRPMLEGFHSPVLILNGEKDPLNRRAEGQMLATAENGRVEILPGAGHLCNLDCPEAFSKAVRGFAEAIIAGE